MKLHAAIGMLIAGLLVGCATGKTEGQGQIEDLTDEISTLVDDMKAARAAITTTLAEHGEIVDNKDGDLIGHFEKFAKGVDGIEDERQTVRKQLEEVKAAARPFFERWKADVARFESEDMRERSQVRLDQTKKRYEALKTHADQVRKDYEGMMSALRDHRLFWSNDLNAASAAKLQGDRPELLKQAKLVLDGIDLVLDWAERYSESIAMRTAPAKEG